jgi:hypothetical protein
MKALRACFSTHLPVGSVLIAALLVSGCSGLGQGGSRALPSQKLVGAWELVDESAPQYRHIKILSTDHFTWVTYDRATGVVAAMGGGTYEFDGRVYIERLEFGTGTLPEGLIGEEQFFTATLVDDQWVHQGTLSNGTRVREVWRRLD